MKSLSRRIVWRHNDGSIAITTLLYDGMFKDETEDEFIQREINKLQSIRPSLFSATPFIKEKEEIKTLIAQSTIKDKRALKCNSNGALSIDETYVSQAKKNDLLKSSIKDKLIKSLKLTDNEAEFLTS